MSFNFPVKVCLKEDIMCENMYYVSCLLLPILLTNQIVRGFDYMGGEESTVPPHNFFSEETSGDYYAPMQEQEAMFQDITSIQKISTDDLSYKLSTEEDLSLSNVYTTIMPDYFQMLPDRNNSEEVYNDGYGENVELSKNATETNQIMNSSGDYPDPFEMDTTTAAGSTMRSKQGKQIQIIKLLPKEALRNFIEDAFIRTPLAAVVDTSPNSLEKTKALWKDALRSNTALDIVLLAFNYSGVAVTYHFQNTRTFLAGLESLKEDSTGDAFYGIIKASELIPYDSAVFVSTAVVPRESSMTRIAAITLLKKRIRLYLIWFGETSLRENETQEITGGILGEVAIRSGGEILHAHSASSFTDTDDNMLTLISDSYLGTKRMEALNDESVRVRLDGPIQTATLETPNGGKHLPGSDEIRAKISNWNGVQDQKISSSDTKNANKTLRYHGLTRIDVSLRSQLVVSPGMMSNIYFEVTNLRHDLVTHRIQVTDEQRFLYYLNPQRIVLPPRQSTTVAVALIVPSTVPEGTIDKITFTCLGYEQTSLVLQLKVLAIDGILDTISPSLTWTLRRRCAGHTSKSCRNHTWSLELMAQDWETGLLRIQSTPNGIIPSHQFTLGTTEAVQVTYETNCCHPSITITATDLAGNQRSAEIDVRNIVLTEASISAIALGTLLLIVLITLVTILVSWCCRRAESRYTSSVSNHRLRNR